MIRSPYSAANTENLRQHGQDQPAGRTGQVMITAATLGIEIFRNARIDLAFSRVHAHLENGLDDFTALPRESSFVKSVGVHDRHVAEKRSVLFGPVGESKGPAQVQIMRHAEIGIKAVAAQFLVLQIAPHAVNGASISLSSASPLIKGKTCPVNVIRTALPSAPSTLFP